MCGGWLQRYLGNSLHGLCPSVTHRLRQARSASRPGKTISANVATARIATIRFISIHLWSLEWQNWRCEYNTAFGQNTCMITKIVNRVESLQSLYLGAFLCYFMPHMRTEDHKRPLLGALKRLRPYWRITLWAYLGMLATVGLAVIIPQFIRFIIDEAVGKDNIVLLSASVLALLVLTAVKGVISYGQGRWTKTASQGVAYDLRRDIHHKLAALSFRIMTGPKRANCSRVRSRMLNAPLSDRPRPAPAPFEGGCCASLTSQRFPS